MAHYDRGVPLVLKLASFCQVKIGEIRGSKPSNRGIPTSLRYKSGIFLRKIISLGICVAALSEMRLAGAF
jgi:hypothetical protein